MTKRNEIFAQARRDLLAEYERGETIDISRWVSRFPDIRDELLSYWMLLRATPRKATSIEPRLLPTDNVAQLAFRRAGEAISLGRSWLQDAVDPEHETQSRIGDNLESVRHSPPTAGGKANPAFRKAAVYAWVAVTLSNHRHSVSRLAAQKVTHLLERGLELKLFEDHRQMPLGPYDSSARYKTAEPIASKQGWLAVSGTQLKPGPSSASVSKYARNYVRSPNAAEELVVFLARLSDSELEAWATVEWVARDLITERKPFDPSSIRQRLATIPNWAPKLKKPNFSEDRISEAVAALVRLRIIDSAAGDIR